MCICQHRLIDWLICQTKTAQSESKQSTDCGWYSESIVDIDTVLRVNLQKCVVRFDGSSGPSWWSRMEDVELWRKLNPFTMCPNTMAIVIWLIDGWFNLAGSIRKKWPPLCSARQIQSKIRGEKWLYILYSDIFGIDKYTYKVSDTFRLILCDF